MLQSRGSDVAEDPPLNERSLAPSGGPPEWDLVAGQALLQAAHRLVAGCICELDAGGRIVHLGPQAAELLGWTLSEARGRSLVDVIHPPSAPRRHGVDDCPLTATLRTAAPITGGDHVHRRDGQPLSIHFAAVPLMDGVTLTGAAIDLHDARGVGWIDDLAREATALRDDRRRLVQLDEVKSRFLNLAAHELRGPLTVARGYMAMLADGSFGPVTAADLRTALPVVTAKLGDMAALIDQMIEIARLEDGRFELTVERFDLRQVVHDALRTITPLAPNHQLLVVWSTDALLVDGDRSRLTTVLTNLLDNACKYSPAGGSVEVHCWTRDGLVGLDVRDEGFGIACEDMGTLFTRFGRVVTKENSHIPGSGLGLYLCREIARMQGGELSARSTHGAGSTFTLQLPAAPSA